MVDPDLTEQELAPPSERILRQFAGLWILFFGGLAGWQGFARDNGTLAAGLGFLALAVGLPGLIRPPAVRWIFVGSRKLSAPVGWVVSHVLLGLLFYGIVTPAAVFFRLLGRDPLDRRWDVEQEDFWEPRQQVVDVNQYFHPY